MAVVGLSVMLWGHKSLTSSFSLPSETIEVLRVLSVSILCAAILLGLSYLFEDWFKSYRTLKAIITKILGPISIPMALYLAALSSISEEILFRGAIQPFAGLVLTSVLFGLLHLSHDGKITSWSLWAFVAGLLMGWVYEDTGCLILPIITHFLVNTISIFSIRRDYAIYLHNLEILGKAPQFESTQKDDE